MARLGKGTYGLSAYIVLTVVMAVMAAGTFALVNTPGFRPFSLVIPIFAFLLFYLAMFEYMYFFHNPKIVFKTGITATLEGSLDFNQSGGKFKAVLWLKKRIYDQLPGRERLMVSALGLSGAMAWLTRDVRLVWYGNKSKLRGCSCVDRNTDTVYESELPEGSFYYEGSLSGFEVTSENAELGNRLDRAVISLRYHDNLIAALRPLVDQLSAVQNKDVQSVAQQLNFIMKQTLEAQRPIFYQQQPFYPQQRGRGGLADEGGGQQG